MTLDKRTLKSYAVSFLLIAVSGLIFHRITNPLLLPKPALNFLLFLTVGFRWITRARRSFPQREVRRYATLFGCACILLCLLQALKYGYTHNSPTAQRYLWYLYYLPFLFAPIWFFFAVMHVGTPDGYRISARWNWVYAPAAALLAAVLTNDAHRLVFRFSGDSALWTDHYAYGPLYYACVAWIALPVAAAVAALIKNCLNRRLLHNLWLPALVLLFAATYWISFNPTEDKNNVYLQSLFELPTFIGYCSFMLWESLRIARIIPSNSGYEDFFAASSLRAGLADRAWNVKRVSAHGPRPAPETLQAAAENEALPLPDGDTVLKTRPVRGGWFYWTEDVGTLRRLNEELKDTAGYLAEENALLQQEAELEEGRRRTAHQTELYNAITKRVGPQLAALDRLLTDAPAAQAVFCKNMTRAALIFTYLKRFSNLLLLADGQPTLPGAELTQALEQSSLWLRELGAQSEYRVICDMLPSETALAAYELFEAAAELSGLTALRFALERANTGISVEMRFAPAATCPDAVFRRAAALGETKTAPDGDGVTLTVTAREGGTEQ